MTTNQPFRILVVDDEALIRWSLCELLRANGHHVVEAASASDARAALNNDLSFDVVLLDYRLPDSNDLNLLAEIRRRMPTSAIVLMTAFGSPEVVHGALQLGAHCVVDKPFDMRDVEPMVLSAYQAMQVH